MQSVQTVSVPCKIVSAGVDWITATTETQDGKRMQEALALNELDRARDRGERIRPTSRMGYVGYASDNFFHGHSENGRVIVVSGARASDLFNSVVEVSDNVARLDVQVTADFGKERPHVATQYYEALASRTPADVRVRNCTLLLNQPEGETLNVGKRKSDYYGRVYDYATAHKAAPALSLWRWEMEVKRRSAGRIAAYIRGAKSHQAASREIVSTYFNRRGLLPPFDYSPLSSTLEWSEPVREHATLIWFRDILSKTIRKQVELHGKAKVIAALGLEEELNLKLERSE